MESGYFLVRFLCSSHELHDFLLILSVTFIQSPERVLSYITPVLMNLINALAQTFSVTVFDVAFFLALMAFVLGMYYFTPLRTLYEVAF